MHPLKQWEPIAKGIQIILQPHAEVVIHDLETNRVAFIANSISKRHKGSPSNLRPKDFGVREGIIGPYEKINLDGRRLKSISIVIYSEQQEKIPIGLLCINIDLSKFDLFRTFLDEFSAFNQPNRKQSEALFRDDWQEKINTFIHNEIRSRNKTLSTITKTDISEIVRRLYKTGGFSGKNTATYIAQVFNVSRATVYNYLKQTGAQK